MFEGETAFPPIISKLTLFSEFLTVVLTSAQDPSTKIKILDILQTFFCWPSKYQGFLVFVLLYATRGIERILGTTSFITFLIYNFICFLPVFLLVMYFEGFDHHFPFLLFIPLSLFVYSLFKIPSSFVEAPLTDKLLVCMIFFLFFLHHILPYTLALISVSLGNYLWHIDLFKIRFCVTGYTINTQTEAQERLLFDDVDDAQQEEP